MDDRSYFDYSNIKGEQLARNNGLHGWISPSTWGVHTCARCNHLDYVQVRHMFDGTQTYALEGVDRFYFDELRTMDEDVSCADTIYSWVASNFGWYHFIEDYKTRDLIFSFVPKRDQKRIKKFAQDWQTKAIFRKEADNG